MTQSNWRKLYKQLQRSKPAIAKKFIKHNKPKDRTTGYNKFKCERCGRIGPGRVGQYSLNFCRQCFREIAEEIGFKKYS
ncbi:30S ribosomal protein S14 [Candidatus Pacearchaeota archaeon]|nr:30S ribosomal protein S14 [Candidatus Pacearchaeota archaeon]|tara:strand:- start:1275 stop:1511 length:237 start_codon:yes stop_codon:yes gene_type:complete